MRDDLINIAQLATTTLYAVVLHRHKHRWEPYATAVEVAIGFEICRQYTRPRLAQVTTRDEAMRQMWRSFLYGGAPIIGWQAWLAYKMWRNVRLERRPRQ